MRAMEKAREKRDFLLSQQAKKARGMRHTRCQLQAGAGKHLAELSYTAAGNVLHGVPRAGRRDGASAGRDGKIQRKGLGVVVCVVFFEKICT